MTMRRPSPLTAATRTRCLTKHARSSSWPFTRRSLLCTSENTWTTQLLVSAWIRTCTQSSRYARVHPGFANWHGDQVLIRLLTFASGFLLAAFRRSLVGVPVRDRGGGGGGGLNLKGCTTSRLCSLRLHACQCKWLLSCSVCFAGNRGLPRSSRGFLTLAGACQVCGSMNLC